MPYLEDARLVPCDLGQGVTEYGLVIVADGGHGAHDRSVEDVGGVVGTADAHLHDGHIYCLPEEHVERHQREEPEVRRLS